MKKIYFILIVILLGGWFSYLSYQVPKDKMDFQIAIKPIPYTEPYFSKIDIPMPEGVASAHSATLTSLENGNLLAAFFAGSKEGAKDVKIYGSIYDSKKRFWSKPFVMLTREDLSKKSKQYIKKLGNPVLYRVKNRIYLFVVGVSIGGWATSKIYELYSDEFSPQKTLTYKQMLELSPFGNISNLVRSTPIALSDGGFILPIYHELADKYSLMVRFDSSGNVVSTNKPNNLHGQLQPTLAPLSHTKCLAVFRNKNVYQNTMFSQVCEDGGEKWLPPEKTNIKNYDNSANLIRFNKDIYLIHNTFNKSPGLERGTLTLSIMISPKQFRKITDLDYTTSAEVSYPTTITDGDNIDIVYTFNRKNIRHIRLNRSFLRTKL
ncbi:exo-alpha-sialidase [Helicobacter cappadocius]|uniref:Sialidase family protein n=1 Tax=Helicobacter cappadocius TaxID=3063998 RepID=A0AA90PHP6_9HELI|nr:MULTISPECIES: sialidase family protein [unclassified Helicobacter]MDO7252605.1 sialidase family protein [Helicobacter sp. faydin-H75]MDP2538472.1 sialidase family protein [Helicobacter sp. faydin-H76]